MSDDEMKNEYRVEAHDFGTITVFVARYGPLYIDRSGNTLVDVVIYPEASRATFLNFDEAKDACASHKRREGNRRARVVWSGDPLASNGLLKGAQLSTMGLTKSD